MNRARFVGLWFGLWLGLAAAPPVGAQAPADRFNHPKHAKLFPRCETCHAGAARPEGSIWPAGQSCEACHDGTIQKPVGWSPRTEPVPSNLRFDHQRHRRSAASDNATCASCHQPTGSGWMTTRRTIVGQCLSCHKVRGEHLEVADSSCATCHVPLVEAKTVSEAKIKGFGIPSNHKDLGFLAKGPRGHGTLAKGTPVAASCATCHARDFCTACHVNAPETPLIQALGPDRRSLAIKAELKGPTTHTATDFGRRHGARVGPKSERCATCHTKESCVACHAGGATPAVQALAAAGPGRAVGAVVTRKRPDTHTADFAQRHAPLATAAERSCATCHIRPMCLQCHRPDPARAGGYHPAAFATRHPAAAYAREASCADCHNSQQFCASCHVQAGMTANRALGTGNYHDAKRFFLFGHGQAARQGLESCVSCHAERDCLTCHSSIGGRRFNPHGPGFDPNRLRRKNPQMCAACHGFNIPNR